MSTKELIDSAVEHLRTSASVKTVYGEPVVVDGKTIIPVAKVAYGFGSGSKKQRVLEGEEGRDAKDDKGPVAVETGEGAGGGVAARPVGVVEISGQETKFVPFGQSKRLAIAAAIGSGLGLVLGVLLGRRSKN